MRKYYGVIHKRIRQRNGIVVHQMRQVTKNGILNWKISNLHNGPARLLVSGLSKAVAPVQTLIPASAISTRVDTMSGGRIDRNSVLKSIDSAFNTARRSAMKGGYIRRIK